MEIDADTRDLPPELREVIYLSIIDAGRSVPIEEVIAELRRLSPDHRFDENKLRHAIKAIAAGVAGGNLTI